MGVANALSPTGFSIDAGDPLTIAPAALSRDEAGRKSYAHGFILFPPVFIGSSSSPC
jgi:hypothetical protein